MSDNFNEPDAEERRRGYVRPLRLSMFHVDCPGGIKRRIGTTLSRHVAERLAKDPTCVVALHCASCGQTVEVAQCVWFNNEGHPSSLVVGS